MSAHYVKSVKNGVFSGTYFPVFQLNTGKYGPEKILYLDNFYAVAAHKSLLSKSIKLL